MVSKWVKVKLQQKCEAGVERVPRHTVRGARYEQERREQYSENKLDHQLCL